MKYGARGFRLEELELELSCRRCRTGKMRTGSLLIVARAMSAIFFRNSRRKVGVERLFTLLSEDAGLLINLSCH